MYKLIVNADDFGLNDGVSRGILKAMQEGIVTSTSIMMNIPSVESSILLAAGAGQKTFGLHLNLTCGKPVLDPSTVPGIVDEQGFFVHDQSRLTTANIRYVEAECRAQLAKFFHYGLKLSHIDSHHHSHALAEISSVFIKLAQENNVPLRNDQPAFRDEIRRAGVKTSDIFDCRYYGSKCSLEHLKSFLASHLDCTGTVELMCHPGIVTEELRNSSKYTDGRASELAALTSGEIKRFITENNISLTNYVAMNDLNVS